ncbi:hypothetical protein V8E51_014402 [Hyaloscypha variabilis]
MSSLQLRERKKQELAKQGKSPRHSGQNKILSLEQEKALIRYAANQCLNRGKGATKQIMYNYAIFFRTKPIASYRFKTEYAPTLTTTGVHHGTNIHNIDKKGARIYIPAGEEVVIPIRVIEIYTRIPKNRLLVTVVEYISTDRKAILPLIIIKGVIVIASWFNKKMTSHELVSISNSGYTNKGIYITFTVSTIKHSFRNAGIWLVSFKAVKKKLKEYGKKRKKDTGLEMLEYGSNNGSSSDEDIQPRLKEPSPDELDEKISHALTSPSRTRYKTTKAGTILKGGIMLALEALKIKKEKEIKLQLETLKKAKAVLAKAEREEREVRYRRSNLVYIPPAKLVLIRDREKEPSTKEIEAFWLRNVALFDTITNEEEYLT